MRKQKIIHAGCLPESVFLSLIFWGKFFFSFFFFTEYLFDVLQTKHMNIVFTVESIIKKLNK